MKHRHCSHCGAKYFRRRLPVNWRAVWMGQHTDRSNWYLKFCSWLCEMAWQRERKGVFDIVPCELQGWDEEAWKWVG